MNKIWAVIPARGGSKGLSRKNVRLLAGKPLIAYAIEAAQRAKTVSRVIVSTDDTEIARMAETWGAEVPGHRPAGLATDKAPAIEAVYWAVDELARLHGPPEAFIVLYPTHPFRTPESIDESVSILRTNFKVTSAFPVSFDPRDLSFMHGGGKRGLLSRESRLNLFQLTGSVLAQRYISPDFRFSNNPAKYSEFLRAQERSGIRVERPLQILWDRNVRIDIDTAADLELAERAMAGEEVPLPVRTANLFAAVFGMNPAVPPARFGGSEAVFPIRLEEGTEYLLRMIQSLGQAGQLVGEYIHRKVTLMDGKISTADIFGDGHPVDVAQSNGELIIRWQGAYKDAGVYAAVGRAATSSLCESSAPFSLPPLWKFDMENGVKTNLLTGKPIRGRQDLPEMMIAGESAWKGSTAYSRVGSNP